MFSKPRCHAVFAFHRVPTMSSSFVFLSSNPEDQHADSRRAGALPSSAAPHDCDAVAPLIGSSAVIASETSSDAAFDIHHSNSSSGALDSTGPSSITSTSGAVSSGQGCDCSALRQQLDVFDSVADTPPCEDCPPQWFLRRIESSDPEITDLRFNTQFKNHENHDGDWVLRRYHRLLADALSLNTCITSLSLSNTQLGTEGLRELCSALTHLTVLTALDFSGMKTIQPEGVSYICETFSHLTALTSIDLGDNNLTADAAARLLAAAAFAGLTQLTNFCLMDRCRNPNFRASDVVSCQAWMHLSLPQFPADLVPTLNSSFYEEVILTHYLMSRDKNEFAAWWRLQPKISHYMSTHDFPLMLRRIEKDAVVTFLPHFYHHNFIEGEYPLLVNALMRNSRITSLIFQDNTISSNGHREIARALMHLVSITELNFRNTTLDSNGATALCGALKHLSALTRLNLECNKLTADDGAKILGAVHAAGMTRIQDIRLGNNYFEPVDVVSSGMWRLLKLPQPPHDFIVKSGYIGLALYLTCSNKADLVRTHLPSHYGLPQDLLRRIEKSDAALKELTVNPDADAEPRLNPQCYLVLGQQGCRMLADALSLNTCITSLNLSNTQLGTEGLRELCSALTHLTDLTNLNLSWMKTIQPEGVSYICETFSHLTALTSIDLRDNNLTADAAAHICSAAAAAGLTRLLSLQYLRFYGANFQTRELFPFLGAVHAQSQSLYPLDFLEDAGCIGLTHFLMSPDKPAFVATYNLGLKPWLLRLVENSDSVLIDISLNQLIIDKISHPRPDFDNDFEKMQFRQYACPILAQALKRNTCITSLKLDAFELGSAAVLDIFLALTHLKTLAIFERTALDSYRNEIDEHALTANDAALIYGAAAAAAMTCLTCINLGLPYDVTTSDVVTSEAWRQLKLPQPPDEFVAHNRPNRLLSFLLSDCGDKVLSRSIRFFFIGDPLAGKTALSKALLSPVGRCTPVDANDRTVGIDISSMQLFPSHCAQAALSSPRLSTPAVTHVSMESQADAHALFKEGQRLDQCGQCAEALIHYEQAVAMGLVDAHAPLAFLLLQLDGFARVGIKPDFDRARVIAEAGRRMGCIHCKAIAAFMLIEKGAAESIAKAMLQESVDSASPYGILLNFLLMQSTDGDDPPPIRTEEFSLIESFTFEDGNMFSAALMIMALYYQGGIVYTQDKQKAYCMMKPLAAQGYVEALEYLEKLHTDGIDVQLWDLAGHDVYTLSHSVHFSHRCLYLLLWKPDESPDGVMRRVTPWLESLFVRVPDAHIVLVASHCKTNITDREFQELSNQVESAVRKKVLDLNEMTRLEVDSIRKRLPGVVQERQRLQSDYETRAWSTPNASMLPPPAAARADADATALPRSLRNCAKKFSDVFDQERILTERLLLLLGIRNGARPDDRDACEVSLHCQSVDSVEGYGIQELRAWLHDHCRSLPFMEELMPTTWIDVANVFEHFGDSVLSRDDAIALARQHLPNVKRITNLSDDELWNIFEFWSHVGRIFVYDSHVVRNPSTLIALLKPLLHHMPVTMMQLPSYQTLLVANSLKDSSTKEDLQRMLGHLQNCDELNFELLDHLSAWKDLSPQQRISMLAFFESSRILSQLHQKPNVRLISARSRAKPFLCEVERVTAASKYHALYLVPLNNIGIIAHLHSAVSSMIPEVVGFNCTSGRDSLYLERCGSECTFSVEDFSDCVEQNVRFSCLRDQLGVAFSCVMRVASNDFGMFKFAAALMDDAMDSCRFGSRFQCWVTVIDDDSLGCGASWISRIWWQFGVNRSTTLNKLKLSTALQSNQHEHVTPGKSMVEIFQPRCSIFISHAWGDGTGEFIKRLQKHLEQKTQSSVWVDTEGLNQQQQILDVGFRNALCLARVVFIVLTPTYLTRPNCLRELRWALDLERAGHLHVVLLALHPAVTHQCQLKLVKDGPLFGLVFSVKENKVKRLCTEAIALVKRLPTYMNTLPWHELEAWRSDELKDDWEEWGTDKSVFLTGRENGLIEQTISGIGKDKNGCSWLNRVSSRDVDELNAKADKCVTMDDTDALTASDVGSSGIPSDWMTTELYPETAFHLVQRGDAAWEPDDKRDSCPGCGKRFNLLLNPRHHCRKCGKVVCGGCAPVRERVGGHVNVRCCVAWCNSP